ncbi:erythromycin esterase family protein [Maribius pontilimi]|uniref:Erythromycin esterase family protein n=1 Tax=Palleronia pontilimi TaxID=1964209 RepID=A0A934IAX3_9RHOB|nr:erythromycin esterase family protein [Palleronia pontilimi]MBJ3763718.1 erythromycin esterase family protein [Palleronia pontilimi]
MDHGASTFKDRAEAGRDLARRLAEMDLDRPQIYALPRGGVPVAAEVARELGAPLDVLLVRKIGAPGNPEVALGAIVEGVDAQVVINEDVMRMSGADMDFLERGYAEQLSELDRRKKVYVGDRARLDPSGRTVVVVDDGLATGATMKAALTALRRQGAARIVVALPVAPVSALEELSEIADDTVCLIPSTAFRGVGAFFRDFHQLSDDETVRLLRARWEAEPPRDAPDPVQVRQVQIPPLGLKGELSLPARPTGIVIFAHGSGSSRLSPRNRHVASKLNAAGFATLLFDLLTPEEGQDRRNVFDIPLLAERLVEATMWVASEPDIADLPVGLFGASTGAGAALVAAAEMKTRIACVVSRGGRPDLAGMSLPYVTAPTVLIVGGLDTEVIALNQQALAALRCEKALRIVPGAGHLFEEPGTLDTVVEHAVDWLGRHFSPAKTPPAPPRPATLDRAGLSDVAEPLPEIDDPAFADSFDRFGSRRIVLLGECSHGTSEFYRARAAITRRLIEQHGFTAVAAEADWPDAAAIDRDVRQLPPRAMHTPAFARFPTWMWRNAEFEDFVKSLRAHNAHLPEDRRVGFHGLDLYNMNASIAAVLDYLDRVDPAAAKVARKRYGCLSPWSREPAAYGRAALTHGFAICEGAVNTILVDLLKRELDYATRDGDRFFDAAQNARLVANAERYYRAMYYGSHVSWNLRDSHMFETLKQILEHGGPDTKVVIWAHNSHIGDARFTDMGQSRGELNIGQLTREAFGDDAALIGFGTATGTVAAASEWDTPMQVMQIRRPRPDSYEALCHDVGHERFLLDLRQGGKARAHAALRGTRLERYIGVIYRPETERSSHYSAATLADQFDAYVWFDRTKSVTPLPTTPAPGEDELYPFGL